MNAGGDGDPPLKLPPRFHLVDDKGGRDLAKAVGDEEGYGDQAVVADPGEPLQAPLEPNGLHQIDLGDLVQF